MFAGLGCLGGAMTQSNVAQLMRHYSGDLAFGASRLDHSAVYKHRTTGQRESVDVTGVDNFEVVTKLGMLELRWNRSHQPLPQVFTIRITFLVAHQRELLFCFRVG